MSWILAAILWLAPHLGQPRAEVLAAVTAREARQHSLDPLIVISYVQTESRWRSWLKSKTEDSGLGQVHVSATTNPELLGYQRALLNPEYNLAVTASMMRMWRNYHERECDGGDHHWLDHMKYGYQPKNGRYSKKVLHLHRLLRQRFQPTYPES